MKLAGKVVIVTGAASGIGEATAMLFADEGASVVVADHDEVRGEQVAGAIRSRGAQALFVRADVSKPDDVQAMVRVAIETYGQLDVIFNNAGIEGEMNTPTADCTLDNWHRVIEVNLTGVFLGMKYAIPEMLKNGGGSIINNASVAGLVGRVNAICPGVIWTPMVQRATGGSAETEEAFKALEPVGRFGTPEEIARMALFLACDDSAFCTGAPFIVDGGFVAG